MRRYRMVALTVVVVFGLSGCGGEDAAEGDGASTSSGAVETTAVETTTTVPETTTTSPATTTTAAPTTTTTQPPPDAQTLWDVYTAYFEAVAVGDWDTAKSYATGVASEYVEMSREFQNISDQTGWALESDTGPQGEVVFLDDGTVAVGGGVTYVKEESLPLAPHDPVFDASGPQPLLMSWGLSISADREPYSSIEDRVLTLGASGGGCGFQPLHAYDPLPSQPMERILITIEVCPDTSWEPPLVGGATLTEVDGETTDEPWLLRPNQEAPVAAGVPTVVIVTFVVEEQALSSPIEVSLQLPGGPETFSIPPFR